MAKSYAHNGQSGRAASAALRPAFAACAVAAAVFSGGLAACETKKTPAPAKALSIPQVDIRQAAKNMFDPHNVPPALKAEVQKDIASYITELNGIIRRRDYASWLKRLTDANIKELSSQKNLEKASAADRLSKNNIVLRSLKDYFDYVVVPSRAHDRVDDIEFVNENRVKAYTINGSGIRLRLYELERTDDSWKIAN